jgi:hypothetical protein
LGDRKNVKEDKLLDFIIREKKWGLKCCFEEKNSRMYGHIPGTADIW